MTEVGVKRDVDGLHIIERDLGRGPGLDRLFVGGPLDGTTLQVTQNTVAFEYHQHQQSNGPDDYVTIHRYELRGDQMHWSASVSRWWLKTNGRPSYEDLLRAPLGRVSRS